MLRDTLYLLVLIVVVFGGGFVVGKQTGVFDVVMQQTAEPVYLPLGDDRLLISGSDKSDLPRGAKRLAVTIGTEDRETAANLTGRLFEICQAIAASDLFADTISVTREIVIDFVFPGNDVGEFRTTMPAQNGACQ